MQNTQNSAAQPLEQPSDGQILANATMAAAEALGLRRAQLAAIIGVSGATLSRLSGGSYAMPEGKSFELALMLVRAYRALYAMVGGDGASMQHWVATPNDHLGGAAPAQRMQSVEGIADVVHYLDAMRGSA
ncbi:MAG: antitoxin Xre/MbcA/ParS toxin-binding domain-containing protein [Pseudomonadales bacterium]